MIVRHKDANNEMRENGIRFTLCETKTITLQLAITKNNSFVVHGEYIYNIYILPNAIFYSSLLPSPGAKLQYKTKVHISAIFTPSFLQRQGVDSYNEYEKI